MAAEAVLELDPAELDDEELVAHVAALGGLQRRVQVALVHATLALRSRRTPAERRPGRLIAALASPDGLSRAEAARVASVAQRVETEPIGRRVMEALDEGRLGLAQAETILGAHSELHPRLDELLDEAGRRDSTAFAQHVRDLETELDDADPGGRGRRHRQRRAAREHVGRDGMGVIRLELPPDGYALVTGAAHAIADELWRAAHPTGHAEPAGAEPEAYAALLADAYVEVARRALRQGSVESPSRHDPVPEVLIIADLPTLQGLHPEGRCHLHGYGRIPITTAHRHLCGANVSLAVVGVDGERVDLGRSVRTANRAQRRALLARDGATCGVPGCTAPWDACQAHHIVPWELGGTTDLDNLVHLCGAHHHLVHEGGWSIEREDGSWRLSPPGQHEAGPGPAPGAARRRPRLTAPPRRRPPRRPSPAQDRPGRNAAAPMRT